MATDSEEKQNERNSKEKLAEGMLAILDILVM